MFPYTTYVSVHGTYDVELAIARIYGGQSCGNGTGSVAFDYDCYGHQPEVLYQRIQESLAQGTEYGYTRSAGGNGSVRLQYLRTLCNDRCAGARRYGRGHALYARVLL